MELLEGSSLADRLRGGAMPVAEALRVVRDVLTGLAAMHAKNVVHRDIKPQNTWLCRDGRVVLMDFGIARTQAAPPEPGSIGSGAGTLLVGTPGYMAPEVLAGASATTASDLYAVGVLLHQLLTGRLPEPRRGTAAATRAASTTQRGAGLASSPPAAIDRPRVPPRLVGVLARLLADDPAQRYPSAAATAAAIAAASAGKRARGPIAVGVAAAVVAAVAWIAWPRDTRVAPAAVPLLERVPEPRPAPIAAPAAAAPAPVAPGPAPPHDAAPPAPRPKRGPRAGDRRSTPAPGVVPSQPSVPAAATPALDEAAEERQRLFDLEKKKE